MIRPGLDSGTLGLWEASSHGGIPVSPVQRLSLLPGSAQVEQRIRRTVGGGRVGLEFIAFEGDAVSERTTPLLPIEKLWEHHLPEDSLLRQLGGLRFATPANGPNKSREDEAVEWQEGVPVKVPRKTARVEERGLLDP